MAANTREWEELNPLQPFFKKYIHTFAGHFLRNYKDLYHIDPAPELKAAVGHIYVRHFLPGLAKEPPPMSSRERTVYENLLKEQKLFSLTIMDMMKDMMVHQAESNARQMAVFQKFMAVSLPSGATPPTEELDEGVREAAPAPAMTPILTMLSRIRDQEEGIKALNIFQDVPVVHAVRILELFPRENQASFQFNRYQTTAVALDGFTFLKSALLPGTVRGELVSLDKEQGVGVLGRFHLANFRPEHRDNIRVRPTLPIKLEVRREGESFHGRLLDISLTGMGVELDRGSLEVDEGVEIGFFLPPDHELSVNGLVTAVRKRMRGSILGVRLFLGDRDQGVVMAFIEQRRGEVLQNLKRLTQESLRG